MRNFRLNCHSRTDAIGPPLRSMRLLLQHRHGRGCSRLAETRRCARNGETTDDEQPRGPFRKVAHALPYRMPESRGPRRARHYDDRLNDSLTEATPQPRPEPHSARFDQDPTNHAKERYPAKNRRGLSSRTTNSPSLPKGYRPGFPPMPFLRGNGSKNLNDRTT